MDIHGLDDALLTPAFDPHRLLSGAERGEPQPEIQDSIRPQAPDGRRGQPSPVPTQTILLDRHGLLAVPHHGDVVHAEDLIGDFFQGFFGPRRRKEPLEPVRFDVLGGDRHVELS
jgi:hypothetical protein